MTTLRARQSTGLSTGAISIVLLLLSEVAAMATWFSTNASVGLIKAHATLGPFHEALLTSSVQAGFVMGTFLSALLTLPDRIEKRRLFSASALIAAAATGSIALLEPTAIGVPVLRFVTGFCMAGVYPVGMAIAATWASGNLGLLIGLLVAALTLGSGLPHLAAASTTLDWRVPCLTAAAGALSASVLVLFVKIGPAQAPAPSFRWTNALDGWRNRAVRLANFGYFGHMWELYAMWTWIGAFMAASFAQRYGAQPPIASPVATFMVFAAGSIGALLGGWGADRFGRTLVTSVSMITSGICAGLIGLTFAGPATLVMAIAIIWGISIVADSAQFSASVAELSDPALRGTMLTLQTCIGFALTLVSIHLLPLAVTLVGWRYAFVVLCIGPALGTAAMVRLRKMPEAVRLANGRR